MNKLNINKIYTNLNPYYSIKLYETLDSTNTTIRNYNKDGLVIISNEQLKGRGRNNKTFISTKDNGIYMSIMIKPNIILEDVLLFNMLISIAICNVLHNNYNVNSSIKWINDIYINNDKIAGILCETIMDFNNKLEYIIIGIGINIRNTKFNDNTNSINNIEDIYNINIDKNLFITQLLNEIYYLYVNYNNKLLLTYKKYSYLLNKTVIVLDETNSITGKVIDFNNKGYLILETDKEILTIKDSTVTIRIIK